MTMVQEVFGDHILQLPKEQAIQAIRSTPMIQPEQENYALREWGEATGTPLDSSDYSKVSPAGA